MRWLPSNKYSMERERLTVPKSKQVRWGDLPQYSVVFRCSRRCSKVQVRTGNNEFQRSQTNWFGMHGYCRTFTLEYGDRCGCWRISIPISCGSSSTQSSQTWIHRWLGPRYTQHLTDQGSLQYLQLFEGCRHICVCEIIAAQIANWNIAIGNSTVVPSKIKTRGHTMMTVHSISGTL